MDTKKISLEDISAFSDGEFTGRDADAIIAALGREDAKDAWNLYHSIGDAMRSDDLAFAMRPDFAARVAARLDAEPTVLAPPAKPASVSAGNARRDGALRRYAIPGAAVAAIAVALIGAPQWMASLKGGQSERGAFVAASAPASEIRVADGAGQVVAVQAQNGVVLRDPRIDDYLQAHQRFSPSVYSTARYARPAAFPADSSK